MEMVCQRWFELDPSDGSLRRRNPAPVGAKELLDPVPPSEANNTFWMVDAEGRVSYTPSDFSAFAKAVETTPKAGPGKASNPKR